MEEGVSWMFSGARVFVDGGSCVAMASSSRPPIAPHQRVTLLEDSKIFVRHPNGGLWCQDEEEVNIQRGVAWDLVKQIGNNFLEGGDIIRVSLPAKVFEPRSFLQRITDDWAFIGYLHEAAKCDDPIRRMSYVLAFHVAGLHMTGLTAKKPFNPLLGETFQAKFPEGSQIFIEQTSHHPPVTHWELIGPDNIFRFHGYGRFSASARGNAIKGCREGMNILEFKDGTKYTWNMPYFWIRGLVMGERVMEIYGSSYFRDHTNKLGCDLHFNPSNVGFLRGFFSWSKPTVDQFRGYIYAQSEADYKVRQDDPFTQHSPPETRKIKEIEGNWMEFLQVGTEKIWEMFREKPQMAVAIDDPLPSDCRYREDLYQLSQNNLDAAQAAKSKLEDKQRKEAKLRKERGRA